MPLLSIVIPTHKRPETLKRCLEHIAEQSAAEDLEVIVVSDGHDPETVQVIENTQINLPLKFKEVKKSQQGIARNKGVHESDAPYCLFIGDDIFLDPHACGHHIHLLEQSHDEHPIAVLGHVTWNPELEITPTMQWLEKSGWQFGYPLIKDHSFDFVPKDIQHKYTYTSNISLPTHTAKKHPFRDDTEMYGWEDIEWGKRLSNAGIPLYYEPHAKAHHHHHVTEEDSIKRMHTLGTSIEKISKTAPHLDRKPLGLKLFLYHLAALSPSRAGRHRKAFLKGMRK